MEFSYCADVFRNNALRGPRVLQGLVECEEHGRVLEQMEPASSPIRKETYLQGSSSQRL